METGKKLKNLVKLGGVIICEFGKNKLCKIFREWLDKNGERHQCLMYNVKYTMS